MKSSNLRSLQLALLSAAVGLTACKKPMTYVHVKILAAAAGEPAAISDVQLDLDLAGKKTSVHLTNGSAPIQFPTDVTLEVKTGAGQLAIIAICRNASGAEVDRATGTVGVSKGGIAETSLQLPGGKPDVKPVEATHEFGSVLVGTSSTTVNVTFHNAGFKPTGPVSFALGGANAGAWLIGTDGCSGTAVPAGGDCAVSLQFNPFDVGALAATLIFNADPGGSPVIALTGTGLPNPQNVAVTISGNGSGTVTSNPIGLSCSIGTCTQAFDYGTVVTLTPTAVTGSHFDGWTGACTGTGACTPTTAAAVAVTAIFTLDTFAVSVAGGGNGSGSVVSDVGGINCTVTAGVTSGTCSTAVNYGSSVVLTETPATSSNFTSFTSCASSTATTCTISNIIADSSSAVTFTLKTFTLTVAVAGSGGTVTSSPSGISCGSTCSATFNYGQSITLGPSWTSGKVFNGWSGGCSGNLKCAITITANTSTTATFSAGGTITWDPAWSVAGVTYTNGNLSISGNSAGTKNARTTLGRGFGKWYWESTATAGSAATDSGGLGVADANFPNNSAYVGASANSLGFGYGDTFLDTYFNNWSGVTINGTPGPSSSINTGMTYMFALDMDLARMWIGQNGTWYNAGNPSTGTSPTVTGLGATVVYPAVTFYPSSVNAFTANFGASLFANQVPTGFNPGFYGSTANAGYPTQFPQAGSFGQDYLLGEQITVTQKSTLLRFGVIASAIGPQVKMGLYSDVGGNPTTLLAQIPATNLVVGNLEVPTTQINLAPGNYWLMADYNVNATPFQEASATSTNTIKYISLLFASALPSTYPAAPITTTYLGAHFNYYIVVAQ